MKIAIIYNRDSQAVINLFGLPNREKYGLKTINTIKDALKQGGYQVKAFEGDKNIISKLEEFMPSVISGELPGLVFNLSYGIQGKARYTHIPGILEMLGIPYVGSSPVTHAIALDKVVTKQILLQKGLPTPRFAVLDFPESPFIEELRYPLIVKPKDEAVSIGMKIVYHENDLRKAVANILQQFQGPTLVEEYISGREFNVGLLGNNPVEAFPPVELVFGEGEQIYTYEDKTNTSGRHVEKICPPPMSAEEVERLQSMAIAAFQALGCFDSARVDFRLDSLGNPYILEVNSLASLGPTGSYVFAAKKIGMDYMALVNRLIEVASKRYFGLAVSGLKHSGQVSGQKETVFNFLTKNRDKMEEELKLWTNLPSWTNDAVGLGVVVRKLNERLTRLGLSMVDELSNKISAWTWQTKAGLEQGTLLVVPIDIPRDRGGYPVSFRREPEWLFGEGIASSRAGMMCMLQALEALRSVKKTRSTKLGIFIYSDEGRGMRYSSSLLRQAAKRVAQVIVLMPGYREGKVVDQRRGFRKFSIRVDGSSLRIGSQTSQVDTLTWFLKKAEKISGLSRSEQRLSVAVQDVHSERYSMLLPHRVMATVYVTYLNPKWADQAEAEIKEIFTPKIKGIQAYVEKLEERPALTRKPVNKHILLKLNKYCEDWKLPFGVEASLLPSAAGEIPAKVPVVCGFGPASQNLYTPYESVNRGELLQRTLLLTLFLLDEVKKDG